MYKSLYIYLFLIKYRIRAKNVEGNLELNHLTLPLLITTQFKVFASFQWNLFSVFAFRTFHPQNNFLCCFCFLPEDGLGLTAKTLLFAVITSSALRGMSLLTFLILRHFVSFVYFAFFAKSTPLLRYVNL